MNVVLEKKLASTQEKPQEKSVAKKDFESAKIIKALTENFTLRKINEIDVAAEIRDLVKKDEEGNTVFLAPTEQAQVNRHSGKKINNQKKAIKTEAKPKYKIFLDEVKAWIRESKEGLVTVEENGKKWLIDLQGNEVLAPVYESIQFVAKDIDYGYTVIAAWLKGKLRIYAYEQPIIQK